MAQSSHSAVLSLLCTEDSGSIFCDEVDGVGNEFLEDGFWDKWIHKNHRNDLWESLTCLPVHSEECLVSMIHRESEHLPARDYLTRLRSGDLIIEARVQALDWIFKAHAHFNFGPLCAYLAVNYFDRFLSAYELPKGKEWTMRLLAIACLSLAAKMDEGGVPSCLDLQVGDDKFVFDAKAVKRMELLVLSTLNWRMRSVTPFSFIDCFFKKINGDRDASRFSIGKSLQLVQSMLKGIYFLEFRPSEIAAAVVISVAVETEGVDIEKVLSALTPYVQKDRVIYCLKIMELPLLSSYGDYPGTSIPFVPQSPIGVLDAACLSYKTDDSGVKRRKLNGPREI
ncbi:PREDICTED: cyclin-D4-1-like isoform X1 [Ipomoea nil]|uniref:cyclin-D4-1-like isoform X1 n=1 Tax=Ipomoea nil TaxID=35883 RepID=UPI000900E8E7|nr:PREDICTED: cyclin-D4-1-like isoform X1 [Ipomoea nil]